MDFFMPKVQIILFILRLNVTSDEMVKKIRSPVVKPNNFWYHQASWHTILTLWSLCRGILNASVIDICISVWLVDERNNCACKVSVTQPCLLALSSQCLMKLCGLLAVFTISMKFNGDRAGWSGYSASVKYILHKKVRDQC